MLGTYVEAVFKYTEVMIMVIVHKKKKKRKGKNKFCDLYIQSS